MKRTGFSALLVVVLVTSLLTFRLQDAPAGAQGLPAEPLVLSIAGSGDDVEQLNGAIDVVSGDLDITAGTVIGLRYTDVCVSGASSVVGATLTVTSDEVDTVATSATIRGQAVADAPVFESTELLDGLARTSESVSWSMPSWVPGDKVTSPDLGAIVREIVGQPGWVSCNDIVLFIDGTGDREMVSFDGAPTDAPTLTIEIEADPPPPPVDSLVLSIARSRDDVEQLDGAMVLGSGDLDVTEGTVIGLRYSNVCVPDASAVVGATLTVTGDEVDTVATSATIKGQAVADAPQFDAAILLDGLARTGESVSWSMPSWVPGDKVTSPDLGAIVREIVGQPGWVSCNDIVLFIDGTGDREMVSFNGAPADAPVLTIDIDTETDPPPPPVTDDELREAAVAQVVAGLESSGNATGSNVVFGGGFKGLGTGWYQLENASYPDSIMDVLVAGGHLDGDNLLFDPDDTVLGAHSGYDFLIYRCLNRVAVFAKSDGTITPSAADASWWADNGCTQTPFTRAHPYFQIAAPLDYDSTRVDAVTQALAALESYATANGTYKVAGGGAGGNGQGYYQRADGPYPDAISAVLAAGGHLDLAGLITDPLDIELDKHTAWDLRVQRCDDRVAVFARNDGSITPTDADSTWWTDNNCTSTALDSRHTYFQLSRPLDELVASSDDDLRVVAVGQAVAALESWGAATGSNVVAGGGSNGLGQGWYQRDSGSSYTRSIMDVLIDRGHLDLDAVLVDPRDTTFGSHSSYDFMVYRCANRVAVFAKSDSIQPSAADAAWWADNGCTRAPIDRNGHPYFQIAAPLPYDDTRVLAVEQAIGALERYAAANGTYTVTGGGSGGKGQGYYQLDNDGGYPDAIMDVLVAEGHLDLGGVVLDPVDIVLGKHTGWDLRVHRCSDRIAVFARNDGIEPSTADAAWWTDNNCTTAPFGTRHTFFKISKPLNAIFDPDAPQVVVDVTTNPDGGRTAQISVAPQVNTLGAIDLAVSLENRGKARTCALAAAGTAACAVDPLGDANFAVSRDQGWTSEFVVGTVDLPPSGEIDIDVQARYDLIDGELVEGPTGDGPSQAPRLAQLVETGPFSIDPVARSIPNGSHFSWTWTPSPAGETAWTVAAWDESGDGTHVKDHVAVAVVRDPIYFIDQVTTDRQAVRTCIEVRAGGEVSASCVPITGTGDVTCDGKSDIGDALSIAQRSVGLPPAEGQCFAADQADVNGDGNADIGDALLVAQCSVGLVNVACPRQPLRPPTPRLELIVSAVPGFYYRQDHYWRAEYRYRFDSVGGATGYDVEVTLDGEVIWEYSRTRATTGSDFGDGWVWGSIPPGYFGEVCISVQATGGTGDSTPSAPVCESAPDGTPEDNRETTPDVTLEFDGANDDLDYTVDGVLNRGLYAGDFAIVYSRVNGIVPNYVTYYRSQGFTAPPDWNPIANKWTGEVCVFYSIIDRGGDAWPSIPGRACVELPDDNTPSDPQPTTPQASVDKSTIAVGETVAFTWADDDDFDYHVVIERDGDYFDGGEYLVRSRDLPMLTSFGLAGEYCLTLRTTRTRGDHVSDPSAPVCVVVDPDLEAPVDEPTPEAERSGDTAVTVSFPRVPGASGYLYRATDDGVEFISPTPTSDLSFEVDFGNRVGLICVYVRALGGIGDSYETKTCIEIKDDVIAFIEPECGSGSMTVSITNNGFQSRWYDVVIQDQIAETETVIRVYVSGGQTRDRSIDVSDLGAYNFAIVDLAGERVGFAVFKVRDCDVVTIAAPCGSGTIEYTITKNDVETSTFFSFGYFEAGVGGSSGFTQVAQGTTKTVVQSGVPDGTYTVTMKAGTTSSAPIIAQHTDVVVGADCEEAYAIATCDAGDGQGRIYVGASNGTDGAKTYNAVVDGNSFGRSIAAGEQADISQSIWPNGAHRVVVERGGTELLNEMVFVRCLENAEIGRFLGLLGVDDFGSWTADEQSAGAEFVNLLPDDFFKYLISGGRNVSFQGSGPAIGTPPIVPAQANAAIVYETSFGLGDVVVGRDLVETQKFTWDLEVRGEANFSYGKTWLDGLYSKMKLTKTTEDIANRVLDRIPVLRRGLSQHNFKVTFGDFAGARLEYESIVSPSLGARLDAGDLTALPNPYDPVAMPVGSSVMLQGSTITGSQVEASFKLARFVDLELRESITALDGAAFGVSRLPDNHVAVYSGPVQGVIAQMYLGLAKYGLSIGIGVEQDLRYLQLGYAELDLDTQAGLDAYDSFVTWGQVPDQNRPGIRAGIQHVTDYSKTPTIQVGAGPWTLSEGFAETTAVRTSTEWADGTYEGNYVTTIPARVLDVDLAYDSALNPLPDQHVYHLVYQGLNFQNLSDAELLMTGTSSPRTPASQGGDVQFKFTGAELLDIQARSQAYLDLGEPTGPCDLILNQITDDVSVDPTVIALILARTATDFTWTRWMQGCIGTVSGELTLREYGDAGGCSFGAKLGLEFALAADVDIDADPYTKCQLVKQTVDRISQNSFDLGPNSRHGLVRGNNDLTGVATSCVETAGTVERAQEFCVLGNVFYAGQGKQEEHTAHIAVAQQIDKLPAELRLDPNAPSSRNGWYYSAGAPCGANNGEAVTKYHDRTGNTSISTVDCDEYPFFTTTDGYRRNGGGQTPSTLPMSASANRSGGADLGQFVRQCDSVQVDNGANQQSFLVVPTEVEHVTTRSFWTCAAGVRDDDAAPPDDDNEFIPDDD